MAGVRKIRGLIGILEAEADGGEWRLDFPSEDFIPGLGLGTTDEARRWAWIGYQTEMRAWIEATIKKTPGRPPRDNEYDDIHCRRAEQLRLYAMMFVRLGKPVPSQRKLIELAKKWEAGSAPEDQYFRHSTDGALEQSVSRGKKRLEINRDWSGGVFAKFDKN